MEGPLYVNIRGLGMHVGREPHAMSTTFLDQGVIPADCVLRRAYSGIHLTLPAFVAGTLRLLRNPFFVHTLQAVRDTLGLSPVAQIMEHYSRILAAIYGDTATLQRLREHIAESDSIRLPVANQPAWLLDGSPQGDFSPGDLRQRRAVLCALVSPAAIAHFQCTEAQTSYNYFPHLRIVAKTVFGTTLPAHNIHDLFALDQAAHDGVAMMDTRLLERSGAWEIMTELLEVIINPSGTELGSLQHIFSALMREEDLAAWGLRPSARAEMQKWFGQYTARFWRRINGPADGAQPAEGSLTNDDLFAVYFRDASN